jgi:teichuronic acid biosynthesis glycosyltransferase TuaC
MPAAASKRLNVLFFTNLFPTPVDPTRGIFHLQLVRELASICDITVVCPLPWFPRWPFLKRLARWYAFAEIPREYEISGIHVYSPKYLMLPKVSGAMQGRLVYLGSRPVVQQLHRQLPFDVINALWLYPDAVAAAHMGKELGIPMVPAALGCDVNRMLNESDKRDQIVSMLKNAERIISVSDGLRDGMVAEGVLKDRVSTISNGVNTDLFFPREKSLERSRHGLPPNKKIAVYVGRLAEEKGLTTLVAAAGLISAKRQDFLLCIVGDGPQMDELRAQTAALGVSETINFIGHQNHEAIASWLGACDVFCLPSIREGCPNVVIEALSSGRPVVASRVGGIPDMVKPYAGALVEPAQPVTLAEALNQALDQNWDTEAIANSVNENTWRATAEVYLSVYKDAVSAHKIDRPQSITA